MTGVSDAVDLTLVIGESMRVNPYQIELMVKLNSLLLWDFTRINTHSKTKFGDDRWYSAGNKSSVTFYNCSPKLTYQLKSLALGMYTQGIMEGGTPLSWNTIGHLISNLKRFGKFIGKYKIFGLDELDDIGDLKIREIIREMVVDMKMNEHPSVATAILKAMYWVRAYQICTNPIVYEVMKEYLKVFELLKKERQNKHPVIPPRIMNIILHKSELQFGRVEEIFETWSKIQHDINYNISVLASNSFCKSTYSNTLSKGERKELDKYHHTINSFRRYVYGLVLSYTGMRLNEVIALPDDAAITINEKYYLKTLLSKTADEPLYLEWVTNKITYDAVVMLSKINKIYRERAELMLTHHAHALPETRRVNLQYGLDHRELFNVQHRKQSCTFTLNTGTHPNGFSNLNTLFNIPVTAEDIKHLNSLNCNYQSVAYNHKGFRTPYKVGDPFNFSDHMFRHTFAWFIIANRLGDLDDIKYQFKHLESSMTLVYSQRGYDTMEELINLTESFSEFMTSQAINNIVSAAEDGVLAGRGGGNFISRMSEILNGDLSTGNTPHFSTMEELLIFTAKHTSNFRGLSHGYCTKGSDCKVRNVADPSHCVNCSSYIATPKHLPHWLVIKQRCETQLEAFDKFPDDMKSRFMSFSTALTDNLNAANIIIKQLTIQVKAA